MSDHASKVTPIARDNRKVGLSDKNRQKVAESLSQILEDTYSLLVCTQIVHWNVRGQGFFEIHKLTEGQYEALFESIDVIAERILALGFNVPAKGGAILSPTGMVIDPKANADDMLEILAAKHEAACRSEREAAELADEADDLVTTDMLTDSLREHEKSIWMLRAQKRAA